LLGKKTNTTSAIRWGNIVQQTTIDAESLTRKAYGSRDIPTRSCKKIKIEVDRRRMKDHVKKEFVSSM
jgi:hypothetical protein